MHMFLGIYCDASLHDALFCLNSKFLQGCAQEMVAEYADACRETLALPTVKGVKSPKER